MSNLQRSSIYIHFDDQDQGTVSQWFSPLYDHWWKVIHSGERLHVETEKLLAEYDLVVLVISKNIYSQDGQVKTEFREFYNIAVQQVKEKVILIILGEAQLPEAFAGDDLPLYQHKNAFSTTTTLDFLRTQNLAANLRNDLKKINTEKIEKEILEIHKRFDSIEQHFSMGFQREFLDNFSKDVNNFYSLLSRISADAGELFQYSKLSQKSIDESLKNLEEENKQIQNSIQIILASSNSILANTSSPSLSRDEVEDFQLLSTELIGITKALKNVENDIKKFLTVSTIDPNDKVSSVNVIETEAYKPRPWGYGTASMPLLYLLVFITAIYLLTVFFMFSALSKISLDIQSVLSPINLGTPVPTITQTKIVKTPTSLTSLPLNPTQVLGMVFREIDNQFQNNVTSNIAFNKPKEMKKGGTATIEFILNPSLSQSALATQLVQIGGFVTSTAEPNTLIGPSGERVVVATSQIEITPRMKAVLLPQDPGAFTITNMLDAEQVISTVKTTTWRWSVTAKKEGSQTLELIVYQLVKYDGKDYWHEVETYKADIAVQVTLSQRMESWNWFSIISATVAIISVTIAVLTFTSNRKKKPEVVKVAIGEEKEKAKGQKKGK
jgi:hypothetical protein